MADETPQTDPAGIARTETGEITAPAQPTPESTTSSPTPAQAPSLLNATEKPTEPSKEAAKDAPKAEGAPEKYEDYTLPDGYTLDPEIRTEVDGIFKGLGLSQEGAQKLVDLYVKTTTDAFNQPFDAYQEMTDGWKKESLDHPDLRGKMDPGGEILGTIGKYLTALPDQKLASDFRSLMDLTGTGNNQAFIRMFYGMAKQLTEGGHVAGNGPSVHGQSPGPRPAPSAAQAMYPHLPSGAR